MAQAPLSPASSPRLPSPPPFPEVQIGPKSPSPGAGDSILQDVETATDNTEGEKRRIRPGTKAVDMAVGPELVPLSELDSSFQLQEYLRALYLSKTRSADSEATTTPITRESATEIARAPDGVERALWLYELCRLLVQRANSLIVGFFADTPPCSAAACPEMRASEWQYLCAVHDPPKSCCAIDYCCHTLDWAANVLTSQKHFPSRLALGGHQPGDSQASVRQLTNIFRRVYRMFAHAWFQHREVFWSLESQEGLYIFYKTVCDVYQLIPEENYTVPAEAEHGVPVEMPAVKIEADSEPPNDDAERQGSASPEKSPSAEPDEGSAQTTLSTGATTRRHKQTPSTGSFVTTIAEGDEDGDGAEPAPPSLLSTVRRDRSSSPVKSQLSARKSLVEDKEEDSQTTTEQLSEKVQVMSLENDTAPESEGEEQAVSPDSKETQDETEAETT